MKSKTSVVVAFGRLKLLLWWSVSPVDVGQ